VRSLSPQLGQVIRRYRLAARLSQEELAARTGLHRTYVSLVERGLRNITVNALVGIGDTLWVSVATLIAEAEDQASRRIGTSQELDDH